MVFVPNRRQVDIPPAMDASQLGVGIVDQGRLRRGAIVAPPDPAVAAALAARNNAATTAGAITVDPAALQQMKNPAPVPTGQDGDGADTEGANDFDPLIPLGVGGGIVGSSMLYRLLRGRKGPQGIESPEFGAPKGGGLTTDADGFQYRRPGFRKLGTPTEDIPYGEFAEVNEPRLQGTRQIGGPVDSAGQSVPGASRTSEVLAQNRLTARDPANMPPSEAMDEETYALQKQRSEQYRETLKRQAELDRAAKYEAESGTGETATAPKGTGKSQIFPAGKTQNGEPVYEMKFTDPEGKETHGSFIRRKDGTAYIINVGREGGENKLGPAAVISMRKRILEVFPDVRSFSGERISGARAGARPVVDIPARIPATEVQGVRAGVNRTLGIPNTALDKETSGLLATLARRIRR